MRIRSRSGLISIALLAVVLRAAPSAATPLQVTFSSNWRFNDPYRDTPDFWNAMGSVGIADGTPISVTALIDDVDTNPDPTIGRFAVQRMDVQIGSQDYSVLNPDFGTFGGSFLSSGALSGPDTGVWSPFYFQLGPLLSSASVSSDDLLMTLAAINGSPVALFLGWSSPSCHLCMSGSQAYLATVERVPEPGTLVLMLGGVFAFGLTLLRQPWRCL
jgi:hypothetical protein